jgi:hypothetical protein
MENTDVNSLQLTNLKSKLKVSFSELKELMAFYPTLEETACWFNCSSDTIERRVKENWNLTFAEFRKRFAGKTRLMIKRKAITMALEENNEKMLLYCLRTMTDLDDRQKSSEIEGNKENVIRLCYSEEFL